MVVEKKGLGMRSAAVNAAALSRIYRVKPKTTTVLLISRNQNDLNAHFYRRSLENSGAVIKSLVFICKFATRM